MRDEQRESWAGVAMVVAGILLLAGCASGPDSVAGPAATVSRAEAIGIAYAYTRVRWTAEQRHVRHGMDAEGILVHTPDRSLNDQGFSNGWWEAGREMTGMPYQWGGFDTPRQFLGGLERGEAAGDISTAGKRSLGDAGTSSEACGIDCSGFISRCWRLPRPYSTKQLPSITEALGSWRELKAGDILLNHRHVLLFKDWSAGGSAILCYEAGPFPVWRVNAAEIPVSKLRREGYQPRRYQGIRD